MVAPYLCPRSGHEFTQSVSFTVDTFIGVAGLIRAFVPTLRRFEVPDALQANKRAVVGMNSQFGTDELLWMACLLEDGDLVDGPYYRRHAAPLNRTGLFDTFVHRGQMARLDHVRKGVLGMWDNYLDLGSYFGVMPPYRLLRYAERDEQGARLLRQAFAITDCDFAPLHALLESEQVLPGSAMGLPLLWVHFAVCRAYVHWFYGLLVDGRLGELNRNMHHLEGELRHLSDEVETLHLALRGLSATSKAAITDAEVTQWGYKDVYAVGGLHAVLDGLDQARRLHLRRWHYETARFLAGPLKLQGVSTLR